MSDRIEVHRDGDVLLERHRGLLLIPAIVATCVGVPLLALSVLLDILGAVLLHAHPELMPAGVTYLPPSTSERVEIIVREAVPVVAGLGFLVLTWRFRGEGRRAATLLCAVAVILAGVASLW